MRVDWPYKHCKEKRKPRGFWKDRRTVAILWASKVGALSDGEATEFLRTMPDEEGHRPSDVQWFVRHYDLKGWPNGWPR